MSASSRRCLAGSHRRSFDFGITHPHPFQQGVTVTESAGEVSQVERLGDVRTSVSDEEGGTPTVAAKHTTEHPPCHSELRRSRAYRWPLRSRRQCRRAGWIGG